MKTDRELLEMAAKAAGYTLVWGNNYIVDGDNIDCTDLPYVKSDQQDEADCYWNPLVDDGDALRLAVKLGLAIRVLGKCVFVESDPETLLGQSQYSELEMYRNSDPYAATRRAIVRAAAAIGEAMP